MTWADLTMTRAPLWRRLNYVMTTDTGTDCLHIPSEFCPLRQLGHNSQHSEFTV